MNNVQFHAKQLTASNQISYLLDYANIGQEISTDVYFIVCHACKRKLYNAGCIRKQVNIDLEREGRGS